MPCWLGNGPWAEDDDRRPARTMPLTVGLAVGLAVGLTVGLTVGLAVGLAVGDVPCTGAAVHKHQGCSRRRTGSTTRGPTQVRGALAPDPGPQTLVFTVPAERALGVIPC
jgi:hypothetical protein